MSDLSAVLSASRPPADIVDSALETVRRHLGMEVAYLSEFVDGRSVFHAVSAPGLEAMIAPGMSRSLDEVYCRHIIDGRLPRLIPDTAAEPAALAMPITAAVPIGSHVSVPVHRADGSVYGMFCCLSPRPNPTLTTRDLAVMELFASVSAEQVNAGLAARSRLDAMRAATAAAMEPDGFSLAFQPIVDLASLAVVGCEALCRFSVQPYRSPDRWFADAAAVGMGEELECAVAARALDALAELPPAVYLSVNASPATVASGALGRVLDGRDLSRIVLEVTEQAAVEDHDLLAIRLDGLRDAGLRLAVDDAGAGYAGLAQILRLRPDLIKLDMSLTRDIDTDHARAALAQALAEFARRTDAAIVAEGIETDAVLRVLRDLGMAKGQGWLLGRPAPLDAALALVAAPRRRAGRASPA